MRRFHIAIFVLTLAAASTRAWGVTLTMDYSNDTFFATHPVAKATLEMTATDLGSFLTTALGATTDTSTGTAPDGSSCTFDFKLNYHNPSTAANELIAVQDASLPANQIKVFVGMRALGSGTLGKGGPGDFGLSAGGTPVTDSGFTTAVHNAETAGNMNLGRGGGPTIDHITNSIGGNSFTINLGSTLGNLSFNNDTNNDGVTDDDATLNSYWQFDRTQPVGANQYDFYSVALHELTHALGFGTSQSWNNDATAATHSWSGQQAIALLGTGTDALSTDNGHIASGTVSTRLSDGSAQQAVMDSAIFNGQRKKFTRLDLAFMRDIGWQTIAYPLLIGDLDQDNRRAVADLQALMAALTNENAYQTSHGFSNSQFLTVADVNGDHLVTNTDLQALLSMLANDTQPQISPVPEPSGVCLVACGLAFGVAFGRARRLRRTIAIRALNGARRAAEPSAILIDKSVNPYVIDRTAAVATRWHGSCLTHLPS